MEIVVDVFAWPRIWTLWVWVPVVLIALRRDQWAGALALVGLMSIGFTLQGDLLESLGWSHGVTGWIPIMGDDRALVVYHLFMTFFTVLMITFPATRGIVLMAEVISLFILSFIASTIMMMV